MKKLLLIIFNLLVIPPVAMYSYYTFSPAKQALDNPPTVNAPASPKVLGATDNPEQIYFTVNIPATFKRDISAPNIVYSVNGKTGEIDIDNSLVAGSGIGISGRTISNTGILTLVAGDGVSIDGNKITNSGILSLEAGTNISIDGNTITNTYTAQTIDYGQSGWTDNGSTIVLTTTTDTVTVGGLTFDSATITNGNSFLPDTDMGSDLGSAAKRFNNLWVANINSNSSQSFSGQTTFSYAPQDTTLSEASVLINPTTSAANGQLLGLAIAGYQKAMIDEDGDITLGYSNAISAPASDYPLNIYGHGGTRVSFVDTSGNLNTDGSIINLSGENVFSTMSYAGTAHLGIAGYTPQPGYSLAAQSIFAQSNVGKYLTGTTSLATNSIKDYTGDNISFTNTGNTTFVGNVGIGTTSPISPMQIVDGSGQIFSITRSGGSPLLSLGNLRIKDTNNDLSLGAYQATTPTLYLENYGGGKLNINFNESAMYLHGSSGNVGVGTTSPTAQLDIAGSDDLSTSISFQVLNSSEKVLFKALNNQFVEINSDPGNGSTRIGTTTGTITFNAGYNNVLQRNQLIFYSGGSKSSIQGFNSDPGVAIGYAQTIVNPNASTTLSIKGSGNTSATKSLVVENSDLTKIFTILDDGNIGIGTTSPTSKLHILGTADNQQLIIQGNSTQTTNIVEYQDSSGNVLGGRDKEGRVLSYAKTGSSTNFFAGMNAGKTTSTGLYNNAIGYQTLAAVLGGGYNNAIGEGVLYLNTSGTHNNAIGQRSLRSNTTGWYNNAIGQRALYYSQTGKENISIGTMTGGYGTGATFTGADYNIILGHQAGYNLNTDMDKNVYIGYQAGYNATGSDKLYIDNSSSDTPLIWGDFANDVLSFSGNVGIGTTNPATVLDIKGGNLFRNTADNGFLSTAEVIQLRGTTESVINLISDIDTDTGSLGGLWFSRSSGQGDSHINVGGIKAIQSGTGITAGSHLSFITKGGGAPEEKMRIENGGFIGVGTTNPGEMFEILSNSGGAVPLTLTHGAAPDSATDDFFRIGWSGSPYGVLRVNSAGDFNFNSDAVFFDRSSGNVGIGTTSPGYKLSIQSTDSSTDVAGVTNAIEIYNTSSISDTKSGIRFKHQTSASAPYSPTGIYSYRDNGTTTRTAHLGFFVSDVDNIVDADERMTIDETGAVTIHVLTTGTVYSNNGVLTNTDPSDETLKDNILTLEDGTLDKVLGLRPVSFDWKSTGDGALSFIAQEVNEIFPELVGSNPDGTLGLYTTQFIPVLAKAIQEQQLEIDGISLATDSAKIVEIETELSTLTTWYNDLKDSLNNLVTQISQFAEEFTTKKVNTKELCIEENDDATCISRDELKQLMELLPSSSPEPSLSPSPSLEVLEATDSATQ